MTEKKRKTLGRDPFEDEKEQRKSGSVEKLIRGSGRKGSNAKAVTVSVQLTPSNIKHLDRIRAELARRGREGVSRNDLIRIAISLLSADDVT